jgi:hypothetical protein
MPVGQLLFATATQAWVDTIGIDSYVIVKALPAPQSTSPNTQFLALYVGNAAVRSLGGFDQLNAAINSCQTDFNGLAT